MVESQKIIKNHLKQTKEKESPLPGAHFQVPGQSTRMCSMVAPMCKKQLTEFKQGHQVAMFIWHLSVYTKPLADRLKSETLSNINI